jgi:phosphoenolpyruvate carboxylase
MHQFADLVTDPAVKDKLFPMILEEHEIGLQQISKVFGESRETRRVSQIQNSERRSNGLATLHKYQVEHLKTWRSRKDKQDKESQNLLDKLLLLINAISGGLKNTG